MTGQWFQLREIQSRCKKEIFYDEGGEILEQVSQRSCRCSIPESGRGQVGVREIS